MKTYKVTASYITYCIAEIEAENEADAYELALNMDGGDFTPADSDDWTISSVEEVKP